MMTPTKGRIVLFVLRCGTARPARIVDAAGDIADLRVDMSPIEEGHNSTWQPGVSYSPLGTPGTWHWPDRAIPAATQPSTLNAQPAE